MGKVRFQGPGDDAGDGGGRGDIGRSGAAGRGGGAGRGDGGRGGVGGERGVGDAARRGGVGRGDGGCGGIGSDHGGAGDAAWPAGGGRGDTGGSGVDAGAGASPVDLGGSWEMTASERAQTDVIVDALVRNRAMVASLQAIEQGLLATAEHIARAQVARCGSASEYEFPVRSMAAEIAAATRSSDRTVRGRMANATTLLGGFPATFTALTKGEVSMGHVTVITTEGDRLLSDTDPGTVAEYEHLVLTRAQALTPGRLRPVAKAIAERLHPVPVTERHRAAREDRCVRVEDREDGMAELSVFGPAVLIHGAYDRATTMADTVKRAERTDRTERAARAERVERAERAARPDGPGQAAVVASRGAGAEIGTSSSGVDTTVSRADGVDDVPLRNLDQLRTDVVLDMLLTGHPTPEATNIHGGDGLAAIRATVQVTVPARVLTDPHRGHTPTSSRRATGTRSDDAGGLGLSGHGGTDDDTGTDTGTITVCASTPTTPDADDPTTPPRYRPGPAELIGHGPIDVDTAQVLAGQTATWVRVFQDPHTGALHTVDTYRPTTDQRRLLIARDEHCRFPGCRLPARRCDIDHTIEHALGGPTCVCDLEHLCEPHHMLRHHSPWQVQQHADGVLAWTSPTGRIYTDEPPPTVRFIPETEPEPPPF